MKKTFLLIFFSCIWIQNSWAQDAEFSQFYAAPAYLNPAMIGFTPEARFVVNYRHQHPSFNHAWITMGAAYDQHFEPINSSVGFSVLADRAAGGLLNTYLVSGHYAYQLQFTDQLRLKTGVQASYFNQNLQWDNLIFDDMIDPSTGAITPGVSTGLQENSSLHRFDLSLGMLLYSERFYAGASFKHITRPDVSFTTSNDPENKLGVRSSFHIGQVWYLSERNRHKSRTYVSPNLLIVNQGRDFLLNGGFSFGKDPLFGGVWLKHNLSNFDALVVALGIRAGLFRLTYSYDINLAPTNVNADTHELSLVFDFGQTYESRKKRHRASTTQCPEMFR